jgi:hypothetical protein
MVDFNSIRSHRGSQNNGFEELVVQLVRRRPPLGAKEFRRIEGAGGDAGVEALWLKNDGSSVGIQAKYFLRVRDIDWTQIDKSVAATLEHRPEVNVYRVAIACDLTDKGGVKGRGRTGWAAWDEHVKRWEADALAFGRKVSFEPITASDLIDWLGQPSAAGLARYWFGIDVLGLPWFAKQVRIASADLGERYTPSQHVAVSASLAFDGLARTSSLNARLLQAVEATWKHRILSSAEALTDDIRAAAERADSELKRVHAIADAVGAPVATKWDVEKWLSDVRAGKQLLHNLEDELREQQQTIPDSEMKPQPSPDHQGHLKYSIRKAEQALGDLARLLTSITFEADASRVLLVTGEAGAGKSHLLAAEANRSIREGRPALLFLGQQFAQGNPWDQCERSLGLPGWPRDELFGALDAAGEAAGTRALILVDAVNEGAGASLWRNHLAGFIEGLAPYIHVAVVVACRTEYVHFAIPNQVLNSYPRVELQGFSTFEEQESAAIQYLDRRGIVRPAGPLLAPEFSHPLFLKAASDALIQRQTFVFPRGLRGALNILGFYLESVGNNLLPASAEPADLSTELRRALHKIAQEMARTKLDYVSRSQADLIIAQTFSPRTSPVGMTWLDVLLRNGIVRLDPDPSAQEGSSFVGSEDVVRIAFQRFQDHLFVQESISGITDATKLFTAGGALQWLVSSTERYRWIGLFEALSIQIPERFGVELVDALPGGIDRWWFEWGIQDGFRQSVRWRATKSQAGHPTFTDRSLALLNLIDKSRSVALLLEVAAVQEHPWNANLLHRNLWDWGLNRRDLKWSRVIAFATSDYEHPVHRLLKWASGGNLDHADSEMIQLVAITLTWLCSSTSRYIRDTATRGLCRLLRKMPEMYHDLLTMMVDVDDLYVLERLLAASYGAACQLGEDPVVEKMATTTFSLVFKDRMPPKHILVRDYALGILEMAEGRGRLPAMVDIAKSRPPFAANMLRAPSQSALEKRREKLGDHSIFWSCGEHGDFGRYEIESAVGHFSATKLSAPPPRTARNRFDLFVAEVATSTIERKRAFEILEEACRNVYRLDFDHSEKNITIRKTRVKAAANYAQECEDAFLSMLTQDERDRYSKDSYHLLLGNRVDHEPALFDARWAQRWVTARAYSLGWNKERFSDDQVPSDLDRQRAKIERIGKKYQWIALHELLAWLSDTHWIAGSYDEQPKRYCYPTDTAFQRDLDPTLAEDTDIQESPKDEWWKLEFNMSSISDNQLTTWVVKNDTWQSAKDAIFRTDSESKQWITLHSFQRAVEQFSDRDYVQRLIGLRREVFQFVRCLIVAQKDLPLAYDKLVAAESRNMHHWEAPKLTDGPYLGEYGWRETWPSFGWLHGSRLLGGVSMLKPVVEYFWESHLDASRPNGVSLRLPNRNLLDLLNLAPPSPLSPYATLDHAGKEIIAHHKGTDGDHLVTIRRDALERLLVRHQLGCLWFVSAERSIWPTGAHDQSVRRWFGSLVAFDGRQIKSFDWETPW